MPGAEGIVFSDPGRIPRVSSGGPGYLRSTGTRSINSVKCRPLTAGMSGLCSATLMA